MYKKKPFSLFEEVITKSWWVILFFLLVYFAYDQASLRKMGEQEKLQLKLAQLRDEKVLKEGEKRDLQLEIASQNDPAWIEMTLMRCLGLVPDGQKKVFFTE